ncbi:UNVERIFIED_CONTAM: hypothetical protein K2H54_023704 [Gekko kuhli]
MDGLRIAASFCSFVSLSLLIASVASDYWVVDGKSHAGLWKVCQNDFCQPLGMNVAGLCVRAALEPLKLENGEFALHCFSTDGNALASSFLRSTPIVPGSHTPDRVFTMDGLRIAASFCSFVSLSLLIASVASDYWVVDGKSHAGLWKVCQNDFCQPLGMNVAGLCVRAALEPLKLENGEFALHCFSTDGNALASSFLRSTPIVPGSHTPDRVFTMDGLRIAASFCSFVSLSLLIASVASDYWVVDGKSHAGLWKVCQNDFCQPLGMNVAGLCVRAALEPLKLENGEFALHCFSTDGNALASSFLRSTPIVPGSHTPDRVFTMDGLRIAASFCSFVSLSLLIASVASDYWVVDGKSHAGLWKVCQNDFCQPLGMNVAGKISSIQARSSRAQLQNP